VPVVVRPTGGGAVLVGPCVLGLEIALPANHPLLVGDVVENYRWLGTVWADALRRLGIDAVTLTIARARSMSQRLPSAMAALACTDSSGSPSNSPSTSTCLGSLVRPKASADAARTMALLAVLLDDRRHVPGVGRTRDRLGRLRDGAADGRDVRRGHLLAGEHRRDRVLQLVDGTFPLSRLHWMIIT